MTAATPYLHLFWKEYRAARTFWLALVALVILAQLLTLALSQEQKTTLAIIYGFALAAPVLFALGSAGAAFAIEKEEGTYDFLQAIPVTARQLVTGKLLLTVLATLAMYLLLWPIALAFTRGTLPEAPTLTGLLGLWLVAALEAIAWATFFSLLISRPLVAICLAVAAASTVAHVSAWRYWTPGTAFASSVPYAAAAVSRIFGALLVLAIDVYLGLRWLHARPRASARPKSPEAKLSAASPIGKLNRHLMALIENRARILVPDAISPHRPDRGAMLGHLFWQHWRQSRGLMVLMLAMHVAVTLAIVNTAFKEHDTYGAIAMATIAVVMGSLVFLPDQERRNYRYFLEHNVPPRYIWLTRQAPWMFVIATSTIAICYFWVGRYRLDDLLAVFRYGYQDFWRHSLPQYYGPRVDLPDLFFATISWVVVAYAAGQWASMHIRSGVMAAFCGLLISAALCGWVLLMRAMQLNWAWTVAPLPIIFLFATWLRAPNWIRENRSWRARTIAALAVLAPTVPLVSSVFSYRVHQIPLIYQGPIYRILPDKTIVQIARFQFDLPPVTPEALATGDLYRKANDLYVSLEKRRPEEEYSDLAEPNPQAVNDVRAPRPTELQWLQENSETISLLLEAARRPSCALADPNTMTTWSRLQHQDDLIYLLITDARRLEFEGHLDEALDRYFDIFQTASHLSDHQPFDAIDWGAHTVGGHVSVTFGELPYWAAQKGQTSDRIRAAIERLEKLDDHIFHFDEGLKANYIIVRRYLAGDSTIQQMFFSWQMLALRNRNDYNQASETAKQILWSTLMPWENNRALRLANLLTAKALDKLQQVRSALRSDAVQLPYFIWREESNTVQLARFFDEPQPYDWGHGATLREKISWLQTTNPNLYPLGLAGNQAAGICAGFGAYKRVWLLLLALERYRLDHGNLPDTLDALVGDYLDELPIDPYSGRKYVYFPNGLPAPATDLEQEQLKQGRFPPPVPGIPCIWSPGPTLVTVLQSKSGLSPEPVPNKETGILELQEQPAETIVSYALRDSEHPYWPESALPQFVAYARGLWYPIPPQQR
jgi:hypothetical protein